jgi:hypothetical protein
MERAALVESLVQAAPWLDLGAAETLCRESDHTLDAVVSALVAMAARLGFTHSPTTQADFDLAVREGWIHLPSGSLVDLGEALDVGA